MPRVLAKKTVTKKESSYFNDVAIWTMIGAYLVGMFVAMELSKISLVESTAVANANIEQTSSVAGWY